LTGVDITVATLRKRLVEYSEDVIANRVISCNKHKQACQRFLKDLTREGKKDFPYLFDEEKAMKFLYWTTLFKHRKGVLAGQNIDPHPIQIFLFANIYGWVHKDTGYRRFRKVYWQVARKNAKSQSLALIATYETFGRHVPAAQVYCGATKSDQAKIVWEEAEWLVRNCEELKGKFKISYGRINHIKSGSYIKALSKEDRKSGDGLDPQCAIIDEYHAHETSEIYDIMVSGMGARPEPLIIIITTAGFELTRPCYTVEYKYISDILDPAQPIENEEYFVLVNELDKDDNIKDPVVWEKANPIICSYEEGRHSLVGELQAALDAPEKMRSFLTKNMNRWIQQSEGGYMRMDKWAACGVDQLPDLEGKEVYIGVDLSSKIDLSSVIFEFRDEGKFIIKSHSFVPEERIAERVNTDKVPYDLWVKQGHITATPGDVIDGRFIETYIREQVEKNKWKVKELCFDPWSATQFVQNLEDYGYLPVEIPQRLGILSEPTKDFRGQVYAGKVMHDNNPVLTWALNNAITKMDHNENIMLDKKRSRDRIDPAAAVITAHARAMVNENGESVYQKRGVLWV
jgi:phage terminase large subunit-like protein